MAAPQFIDYSPETPITASFLNSLSNLGWNVLGGPTQTIPTTLQQLISNLGIFSSSYADQVVDSIAALRTTSNFLSTRFHLTGYYKAGDGGHGFFYVDPNDSTSADNGCTVIVDGLGRRIKLEWNGVLSIEQAGAVANGTSSGSTDNTAAINNVISILQANGGGICFIPPRAQGFAVNGTLAVTAGGVSIMGANTSSSLLVFKNGASDCITFSGPSFSQQIYGFQLRNLGFQFSGKSGGRLFYASNSNQIVLQDLISNGCWTGIELYQNNTVNIKNVVLQGVTGGAAAYGLYWHAASDGSGRSDVLNLEDFAVNAMYSGANGIVIDGLAATLLMTRGNVLQCNVNILVYNSAESGSNFPNYLQFTDVQTEGAKLNTVQINGGANIKFSDCAIIQASGASGQGSNDGYAVAVYPDTGFSVTRNITFSGCSIGQAKGSAVFSNARNVRFFGCDFQAGTTMTANTQPAIQIGADSDNTSVIACTNNIFGTPNNWQYGLLVAAGSTGTIETGNDWRGAQTKEVQWNSTDSQSYAGADLTSNSLPISSGTQTLPSGFAAVGSGTFTTAQTLGGVINVGGTPGSITYTTPTAAALVGAMASPSKNKTVDWLVINTTNGTLTIAPGSGVTTAGITSGGNFTVAQGTSKLIKIIFVTTTAGSESVAMYG